MSAAEAEIVLVEDNQSDAELIVRALKRNNLANKIVLLKDGAEALEFLFDHGTYAHRAAIERAAQPTPRCPDGPRVVLLDLKLPKLDGIEVLRRMKSDERTREIPVVILTSSNQEQDIKAGYHLGVNSFVTKPINFEDFARVVAELGLYWLVVNVPPGR
jgi:CheY-like chemotaxis protein